MYLVSRIPNQIMCDMTFDVTLSLLLSHGVTRVSHTINRKDIKKKEK